MSSEYQAFLSYTRRDDEFFGGAITALKRFLELGVQVVSGQRSFSIFQDVDGIEIGQTWQNRLDYAVDNSRFLIPIVTPLFFASEACRGELEKFLNHERQMGRDDLILPIYFVTTPILEKEELLKNDVLAAEILRRQRFDWREQADLPIEDSRVKRSIRQLAEKISSAISRVDASLIKGSAEENIRASEFTHLAKDVAQEDQQRVTLDEKSILWVDDRPDNNILERAAFSAYNIRFVLAKSTAEALAEISSGRFDAIISDMGRPPDHRAGYTLLELLRSMGNPVPFFIYAGSRAPEHVEEARLKGAQGTTNVASELIPMVVNAIYSSHSSR